MSKRKTVEFAKKLVRSSLSKGKIDPVKVEEVTKMIKEVSGINALEVLKRYAELIEVRILEETAYVETPFEATGKWAEDIKDLIHAKFPEVTYINFVVNPTLIAGVKLQIADMVYENSLKAKLDNLRKVN